MNHRVYEAARAAAIDTQRWCTDFKTIGLKTIIEMTPGKSTHHEKKKNYSELVFDQFFSIAQDKTITGTRYVLEMKPRFLGFSRGGLNYLGPQSRFGDKLLGI